MLTGHDLRHHDGARLDQHRFIEHASGKLIEMLGQWPAGDDVGDCAVASCRGTDQTEAGVRVRLNELPQLSRRGLEAVPRTLCQLEKRLDAVCVLTRMD